MTNTSCRQQSVVLYDLYPPQADFRAEVLHGLRQPQKSIPAKFLYDQQGAELFDQICTLDEYYLTRTELSILRDNAAAIATLIGDRVLLEFGSGSSQKVRILLDAVPQLTTYVGLDISRQHLLLSCDQLAMDYPQLEVIAICADYTQPIALPETSTLRHKRKVGFFSGSSIGNLEPTEAVQFLRNVSTLLEPNADLLISVDLKKNKAILEPAYDDAQGISAAFATNILHRMNRELGADFDSNQFKYRAFYNPIGRIEMNLVSLQDQIIHFDDEEILFCAGEALRTEYSYKYTVEEFQSLAEIAGYTTKSVWTDSQNWYSLHYLSLM